MPLSIVADDGAGFSSNTTNDLYSVKDESKKLTIEEMNRCVHCPIFACAS